MQEELKKTPLLMPTFELAIYDLGFVQVGQCRSFDALLCSHCAVTCVIPPTPRLPACVKSPLRCQHFLESLK